MNYKELKERAKAYIEQSTSDVHVVYMLDDFMSEIEMLEEKLIDAGVDYAELETRLDTMESRWRESIRDLSDERDEWMWNCDRLKDEIEKLKNERDNLQDKLRAVS